MVSIRVHFFKIPISRMDVPFSQITKLYVQEFSPRPSSSEGGWKTFALVMEVTHQKHEFTIAHVEGWGHKNLLRSLAVIRKVTGITRQREIEAERSWTEGQITQRVLEEPGITHTGLLRKVDAHRNSIERAIRQLLGRGDLKCEQRGRSRKYYVQPPAPQDVVSVA